MESDKTLYSYHSEETFIQNVGDRVVENISLEIKYVDTISAEKIGKFCMINNNLDIRDK